MYKLLSDYFDHYHYRIAHSRDLEQIVTTELGELILQEESVLVMEPRGSEPGAIGEPISDKFRCSHCMTPEQVKRKAAEHAPRSVLKKSNQVRHDGRLSLSQQFASVAKRISE